MKSNEINPISELLFDFHAIDEYKSLFKELFGTSSVELVTSRCKKDDIFRKKLLESYRAFKFLQNKTSTAPENVFKAFFALAAAIDCAPTPDARIAIYDFMDDIYYLRFSSISSDSSEYDIAFAFCASHFGDCAHAHLDMGQFQQHGWHTSKDPCTAMDSYIKALDRGFDERECKYRIRSLYDETDINDIPKDKHPRFIVTAAKAGSAKALMMLAKSYSTGDRNLIAAFNTYAKAASAHGTKSDLLKARSEALNIYERLVSRNCDLAPEYHKTAATFGSSLGYYNLALLVKDESPSTAISHLFKMDLSKFDKGIELLADIEESYPSCRALDRIIELSKYYNNKVADYYVAKLYETGIYLHKNAKSALEHYARSAKAGYGPSAKRLSELYLYGDQSLGVSPNPTKGMEFYRLYQHSA